MAVFVLKIAFERLQDSKLKNADALETIQISSDWLDDRRAKPVETDALKSLHINLIFHSVWRQFALVGEALENSQDNGGRER